VTPRAGRGGEPTPLRDSLAVVGAELDLPAPDILAAVDAVWRDEVPEMLREHAALRSLHGGRLVVSTRDAATAGQLRYLESVLLDAFARRCGQGVVEVVAVAVEPSR
jgi:hypothetical protein